MFALIIIAFCLYWLNGERRGRAWGVIRRFKYGFCRRWPQQRLLKQRQRMELARRPQYRQLIVEFDKFIRQHPRLQRKIII